MKEPAPRQGGDGLRVVHQLTKQERPELTEATHPYQHPLTYRQQLVRAARRNAVVGAALGGREGLALIRLAGAYAERARTAVGRFA